jgi:hypothetical protein
MTRADRDLFFSILADLAEARLLRGDPEACLAAVDRALDSWRDVPKEARARLESVRARALFRMGRADEAIRAWSRAYSRAVSEQRERIGREREAARRAEIAPGRPASPESPAAFDVAVPDRGELLVELETNAPDGARVPLTLRDGFWRVSCPAPEGTVRYRLVIDGTIRRIDPFSTNVVLVDHEPWSERTVP